MSTAAGSEWLSDWLYQLHKLHTHVCTGEENKPIDMTFKDQWSIQD